MTKPSAQFNSKQKKGAISSLRAVKYLAGENIPPTECVAEIRQFICLHAAMLTLVCYTVHHYLKWLQVTLRMC